jgi:hypothetical protein
MSDIDVKNYLDQLKRVLPSVEPISTGALKALHAANDYKGMVQLIKKAMNIADVTFKVFWVTEGAAQDRDKLAPAWILLPRLPDRLPFYGTKEFKDYSLEIYFRKSFLEGQTYGQVAIVIAHELSHVVLDSIRHPLFREEKAVDLTAMLLGFRRLYLSSAHTKTGQIGYLSEAEVRLANRLLDETPQSDSKIFPPGNAKLESAPFRNLATSLFVFICIVATLAIWLVAPQLLVRTQAKELPPKAKPSMPADNGVTEGMKATLPRDLINRLDKGTQ